MLGSRGRHLACTQIERPKLDVGLTAGELLVLHAFFDSDEEFLRVVDHKQVIFKITERVMRAVLVSAMKMSAFHAAQLRGFAVGTNAEVGHTV